MNLIKSPLVVGLGAGMVAAVLYTSLATGSVVGLLLFYAAPLPGLIAGLGWGIAAAITAAVVGVAFTVFMLGPLGGLAYAAALAIPAVLLTHYAFLYRVNGTPLAAGVESVPSSAPQIQWYPVSKLLLIITAYGGSIALLSLLLLGPSYEAYMATIGQEIDGMLVQATTSGILKKLTPEEVDRFKKVVAAILPASMAMVWSLLTLFNLWVAAHVVRLSKMLRRPWPDLATIKLGTVHSVLLLALLIASILLGGLPGLIMSSYAAALALAFFLVGLAIVHYVTRGHPLRGLFLLATYIGAVFIGWGAIVVIVIGAADPFLNLRKLPADKTA